MCSLFQVGGHQWVLRRPEVREEEEEEEEEVRLSEAAAHLLTNDLPVM